MIPRLELPLVLMTAAIGCVTSFGSWPADTGTEDVHDVDGDAVADGEIETTDTDAEPDGLDADGFPDVPTEVMYARCGDGVLDAPWEGCDEGAANAYDGACLPTCLAARCGDGFVWAGNEYCDDGNTVTGDACAADCLDGDRIIETVAGGGVCDGLPARAASFNWPSGLSPRSDGTVLVADQYHHRIRLVRPGDTIATYAGTGLAGYSGDGRSPTEARLDHPGDVTVEWDGTVWIGDTYNCRVRMVDRDGIAISTFAGSGDCAVDPRFSECPDALDTGIGAVDSLDLGPDGSVSS